MKKLLLYIVGIATFLLFSNNVDAASLDFRANTYKLYVGDAVTTTATLNSIEGTFEIFSSNGNVLSGGKVTDWVEGGNINTVFTAVAPGTATITIRPITATTMDPGNETDYETPKSLTIVVEKRPQAPTVDINKVYSSNNFLTSLTVDGYELKEVFNKETLEYSLELDYTVEKININAVREDNTASVNGIGEVAVSEGMNNINIVVTAQNGNTRTYVINALVKELNPIYVEVDGKKYSLVKKKELIGTLEDYQESIVKISDTEIPALKSDITNYTLVGLKDSEGNVSLYIYDAEKETYTKYNELTFNGNKLYFIENKDNNYKATKIKINDEEVTVYKKDGYSYYLIYGMNLETGKTGWYSYDEEESTLQRYVENNSHEVNEKNNNYFVLIIILSGIIGLLFVFISILFIKYRKMLKNLKI